jgi:hypothetical protein
LGRCYRETYEERARTYKHTLPKFRVVKTLFLADRKFDPGHKTPVGTLPPHPARTACSCPKRCSDRWPIKVIPSTPSHRPHSSDHSNALRPVMCVHAGTYVDPLHGDAKLTLKWNVASFCRVPHGHIRPPNSLSGFGARPWVW